MGERGEAASLVLPRRVGRNSFSRLPFSVSVRFYAFTADRRDFFFSFIFSCFLTPGSSQAAFRVRDD